MSTPNSELCFARDGHLLDLTIDRYLIDDLTVPERLAVEAYLDGCETCRARVAEAEAFHNGFDADSLPPWLGQGVAQAAAEVVPLPVDPPSEEAPAASNNTRWFGLLAAVAAVLLVAVAALQWAPTPPSEGFQTRGSALPMDVWIHNGAQPRRALATGETVQPGDRLMFELASEEGGHLMILGLDSTGSTYPCWPQSGAAQAIEPGTQTLDAAIALDATPGQERILGLLCPDGFDFADAADAMKAAADGYPEGQLLEQIWDDCAQREVVLTKDPR